LARKKFSCDFETTTKPEDCRVWAYGYMEIGKRTNYKIGNSLDAFMMWVEKIKADLYFHNVRFDGEFIVNWLLKKGFKWEKSGKPNTFTTTISNMGQWYVIDICYGYKGKRKLHTVIYDSLKKLPFPVKKIAKDFELPMMKGDIDYHLERPIGHKITDKEYSYIKNDIEIIACALEIQFGQGLDRITNGSDSLKGFKSVISTKNFEKFFPVFSLDMDWEIRKAYRGGFTWLNERYENKEIGEGIVFDVNSLYPAQMYDRDLPYGTPIYYEGEYMYDESHPLYIQCIECEFRLKEGYIPTIQIKKNMMFKQNEYLKSSNGERVELFLTNIDLELIREHYHLYDVEYLGGWKFRKRNDLFKQFIDKWMWVKTHEEGAKKLLAKLMLNALYGKFASNPKITGKIPYLKEDGSCGYKLPRDEEGNIIDEYKNPIYTPMGIFITSWARYTTITTAQKCYDRIIYCDTDSIHLEGTKIPESIADIVHKDKLGYWKHEGTFKRAKFIRQKTYVEDYYAKEIEKDGKMVKVLCEPSEATTTKFEVRCAGMPDKVKEKVTFDNFKVGFSSWGKLLPKHVDGGVVLVDTEFTIN
jgi:DNA polymerase type B, organellar and viral.